MVKRESSDKKSFSDEHIEQLLDEALEATFPASDAFSISVDRNGQIEQAVAPPARH
jgi:hypothetical protein